jgi:HlyD family secretion protein
MWCQLLAVFANEAALADVAQAKATLAEAQASAADALGNAERARSLQGTEALSAQQSTQFFTAEKSAKARLEAAQASLNAQQLRLGFTQVTAPDSGIISARNATVGAVVGAGTELFRLVRQGRLEWRAEVTSSELSRLKPGVLATVTAASGAQVKGKVRMIAPTVDVQTRAALVYVDLPSMSPGNSVLPGMFAKGTFELGHSNALTTPQQAVVIRDGFAYVFRLTADNHVAQTKVQTGRRNGTQVELLAGVKAADSIVVTGAGFLADGDLVKVVKASIPFMK